MCRVSVVSRRSRGHSGVEVLIDGQWEGEGVRRCALLWCLGLGAKDRRGSQCRVNVRWAEVWPTSVRHIEGRTLEYEFKTVPGGVWLDHSGTLLWILICCQFQETEAGWGRRRRRRKPGRVKETKDYQWRVSWRRLCFLGHSVGLILPITS